MFIRTCLESCLGWNHAAVSIWQGGQRRRLNFFST